MKKSLKQWLSALLVIAMMATLLMVPAAAASAGEVGYTWDFSSKNTAFHDGGDTGTYGYKRTDGGEKQFDGLTLSEGTGSYNGGYCDVSEGATLTIPVTGKCAVVVSTQYGANATVGVDSDTVELKGSGSGITTATYKYKSEDPGSVVVSSSGSTFITKIELQKLSEDPSMTVTNPQSKEVVVAKGGDQGTFTATLENADGQTVQWAAKAGSDEIVSDVQVANGVVTFKGAKVGKTTITVTASLGDGDPKTELTDTVTVYVKPVAADQTELVAGTINFADKEAYYTNTSLIWSGSSWHDDTHGLTVSDGDTVTVKVPEDKTATLTIVTCCYGAGYTGITSDTVTGAATANSESGNNTTGFDYKLTGLTGTPTITFASASSGYVHSIKVELADASEGGGGNQGGGTDTPVTSDKIDVWDFGAEQLSTDKFDNHLTADKINAWYPGVDAGTGSTPLPAAGFSEDGLTFNTNGKATHRLRTSNTKLTRYDAGKAPMSGDGKDPYASTSVKYTGYLYDNGGSSTNAEVNLTIVLEEGDIVTAAVASNSGTSLINFKGPSGVVGTYTYTGNGSKAETATFYAREKGDYQIYSSNEKLVVARLYREHAKDVTVTGSVSGDTNLEGKTYQLVFTNVKTEAETTATVTSGKYEVTLKAPYDYTVKLAGEGTELSVIQTGDSLKLDGNSAEVTHDVTTKAVTLAEVTGKIEGLDEVNIAKLKLTTVPPTGYTYQPEITVDAQAKTYTTKFEVGATYTLTALNVDDYDLTTKTVTSENKDITFEAKAKAAVSGNFVVLDPDNQYEPLKGTAAKYNALEAGAVTGLTFKHLGTNALTGALEEDGYEYTAAVTGTGYTADLRPGSYTTAVTYKDGAEYSTVTHVVVNGTAAVTKDLLFVSTAAETNDYAADVYVGVAGPNNEPTFNTITRALDYIRNMDRGSIGNTDKDLETKRVTVHIAPGTYREQLNVDMANVTFVPADPTSSTPVTLTWYYGIGYKYYSAKFETSSESWYDPEYAFDQFTKAEVARWGATVRVRATGFRAENITFESSFNRYLTAEEQVDGVESTTCKYDRINGDVKHKDAVERAAAIWVDSTNKKGDLVEVYQCEFYSSQDTFGTGVRMYVKDCYIEGGTDYICGPGSVIFDNCTLAWKGYTGSSKSGYITAAQTGNSAANGDAGYLFRDCTVTRNTSVSGIQHTGGYFGRPWSGEKAVTIFLNTTLDSTTATDLIVAAGWGEMNAKPENVAGYKEYGTVTSDGKAVSTSGRKGHVISEAEANAIDPDDFLQGWEPIHYVKPDGEEYTIEKADTTNGTFEVSKEKARENVTVTITATPAAGYVVDTVTVTGASGKVETTKVDSKTYTFSMPAEAVTVTVTFKEGVEAQPFTLTIDNLYAELNTAGKLTDNVYKVATGEVLPAGDDATKYFGIYGYINPTNANACTAIQADGSGQTVGGTTFKYRAVLNPTMVVDGNNTIAAIRFTTTGEATVKVWARLSSDASASPRYLVIRNAAGEIVGTGAEKTDPKASDAKYVETFGNVTLPAGTYYMGSGNNAMNIFKVEVTTTGMTPVEAVTPGEGDTKADLTALNAAITTAEALEYKDIATSDKGDGSDVMKDVQYVPASVVEAFEKALTDAKALTEDDKQADVNKAAEALTKATEALKAAIEANTKGTMDPKAALTKAIADAKAAANGATVSTDGSDVAKSKKWVTQDDVDELNEAIEKAQAVADDETADDAAIAQAIADLAAAVEKFEAAKQAGTKTTPTGGATSGRGDTTRGDTTTPDNTGDDKTDSTDKTGGDNQGSLIDGAPETTAAKTTDEDGNEVVTVTDENGEVLAQVVIPAEAPELDYTFKDVDEDDWFAEAVNSMAAMGVVRGVSEEDHIFDPNSNITRGAMAQILYNLSNGKEGLEASFADVVEGAWYTDAVAWAATAGVVNGYSDNTFGPNNDITREQLAVMLYRYANLLGMDVAAEADLTTFADGAAVDGWAAEAMTWAVANGLIQGKGANNLDPLASASRAETATVLQRFLTLAK